MRETKMRSNESSEKIILFPYIAHDVYITMNKINTKS